MRKIVEPLIHFLLWFAGYLIVIFFIKTIGNFKNSDGTLFYPATYGTILNILLFYLSSLILIPGYDKNKRGWMLLIKLIVLLIGFSILETTIDYFFFTSIYSSINETFNAQLITNIAITAIFISLSLAYGFARQWIKNEKKRQILSEEKLKSELNFLKAQINPHFLFNVLNMAFSSATSNSDFRTADIIEKLSGLMRYMLYESNNEKTDIVREINYIENYINLQQLRLSKDIPAKIEFKVTGDYTSARIAPLLLIPFIENAFKYGLKLEQESEIFIELNFHNSGMLFTVENSVFSLNNLKENVSSGIGLENVKKRLELIYPDSHKLEIIQNSNRFIVRLQLELI